MIETNQLRPPEDPMRSGRTQHRTHTERESLRGTLEVASPWPT